MDPKQFANRKKVIGSGWQEVRVERQGGVDAVEVSRSDSSGSGNDNDSGNESGTFSTVRDESESSFLKPNAGDDGAMFTPDPQPFHMDDIHDSDGIGMPSFPAEVLGQDSLVLGCSDDEDSQGAEESDDNEDEVNSKTFHESEDDGISSSEGNVREEYSDSDSSDQESCHQSVLEDEDLLEGGEGTDEEDGLKGQEEEKSGKETENTEDNINDIPRVSSAGFFQYYFVEHEHPPFHGLRLFALKGGDDFLSNITQQLGGQWTKGDKVVKEAHADSEVAKALDTCTIPTSKDNSKVCMYLQTQVATEPESQSQQCTPSFVLFSPADLGSSKKEDLLESCIFDSVHMASVRNPVSSLFPNGTCLEEAGEGVEDSAAVLVGVRSQDEGKPTIVCYNSVAALGEDLQLMCSPTRPVGTSQVESPEKKVCNEFSALPRFSPVTAISLLLLFGCVGEAGIVTYFVHKTPIQGPDDSVCIKSKDVFNAFVVQICAMSAACLACVLTLFMKRRYSDTKTPCSSCASCSSCSSCSLCPPDCCREMQSSTQCKSISRSLFKAVLLLATLLLSFSLVRTHYLKQPHVTLSDLFEWEESIRDILVDIHSLPSFIKEKVTGKHAPEAGFEESTHKNIDDDDTTAIENEKDLEVLLEKMVYPLLSQTQQDALEEAFDDYVAEEVIAVADRSLNHCEVRLKHAKKETLRHMKKKVNECERRQEITFSAVDDLNDELDNMHKAKSLVKKRLQKALKLCGSWCDKV